MMNKDILSDATYFRLSQLWERPTPYGAGEGPLSAIEPPHPHPLPRRGEGEEKPIRGYYAVCISIWFVFPLAFLLTGCNESPFNRTQDASGGGALGRLSGASLVVFSSELKTGGGAFLFPGGENQTLSFSDMSNPLSARSIRYNWNGGDVSSSFGPQHLFAGFDLMHTPTLATYAATPGRDLRAAGYTKVTFFARGSLSTDTFVKVQVAADPSNSNAGGCLSLSASGTLDDTVNPGGTPCGSLGILTGDWQQYSIAVTSAELKDIKDLFKATLIFNEPLGSTQAGQGGTVYFDQIQYTP